MMKIGGTSHLLMVLAILLIIAGLMIIVYKSNKIVQNIIITSVAVLGTVGIFFLHGTHYGTRLDLKNLGMQMFQVCNFNFILLPLCLFKKKWTCKTILIFLFYASGLINIRYIPKRCGKFDVVRHSKFKLLDWPRLRCCHSTFNGCFKKV